MLENMWNGTKRVGIFSPVHSPDGAAQWAFPESLVRHVYLDPLMRRIFHSRYVCPRKGLKVCIKSDASGLMFFCRLIPISLWVGSLLAVAWGGALCQLGND